MSLLMLSRQITDIIVEENVAVIYSNDDDIIELQTNEKYRCEIAEFFKSKGLSFKVNEKVEQVTEVDELKRLLGAKLKIK